MTKEAMKTNRAVRRRIVCVSGSGGGARPGLHATEPGGEVLAIGIERLADIGHEVEKGEQQDVGHGELVAGDEGLRAHQTIEPLELVARRCLQLVGRAGNTADAVLEHFQALGKAEAVGGRLGDVEVDAARPHTGPGALLRRVADQRGRVLLLFVDVLADRRDLGQNGAVFEFQRRSLARRIDLEIGLAPILTAPQIDIDLGDVEALLGHEHADHAWVRPARIMKLHLVPPFCGASAIKSADCRSTAGAADHRHGSTKILVCRSGLPSSAKAPFTPSSPTLPVISASASTWPSASRRSEWANSSGV